MERETDVAGVFAALHDDATDALLHLVDGFYFNIEDGLFELAFRSHEESERRRCFDLMRELRFRKDTLIKHFANSMRKLGKGWVQPDVSIVGSGLPADLQKLIDRMAEKSGSHFSGVLEMIALRMGSATGREQVQATDLPLSPRSISQAFVLSCRSLKLDSASIDIVQELFGRFVLDRLGTIYGECNLALETAGFVFHELELELEFA